MTLPRDCDDLPTIEGAFPPHLLTAVLIGATALCFAIAAGAQPAGLAHGMPPPAVVVEPIEISKVSNPAEFTARVEAIEVGDIRARVTGYLRTVGFRDGQPVAAGDILFEIEPYQLEATVASAKAQLARAQALRRSAEQTLARSQELFGRNVSSRATLEDAENAFAVAGADVSLAEANLRTAELNLSYTRITSPISGNIGRPTFTAGNLVGPDSGVLARVVSLQPIRVAFAVSEGFLVTIRQKEAGGRTIDPEALELSLRLANGTMYKSPGRIAFIEDSVDPRTGTVTARAVFDNPHRILIPGQYVTLLAEEKDAPALPVVPQTAVLQDRDGRYVYVLEKDNTVTQRRIITGARVGNGWAATSGLKGGELVVVQGTQRLRSGIAVQASAGTAAESSR